MTQRYEPQKDYRIISCDKIMEEDTRREIEKIRINKISRMFIDPLLTVYSPYNPLRRSFV